MNLTNRCPPLRARVDLLPLIDVIFLLLVFFLFLILNMSLNMGIEVTLPTTDQATTIQQQTLKISIDQQSQLYLGQHPVTLAELISSVQQLQAQTPRPILIYGDAQAELGMAIRVLESLETAGFKQIFFCH